MILLVSGFLGRSVDAVAALIVSVHGRPLKPLGFF